MRTLVIHNNTWPWGETETLVFPDGKAIVEMAFQNDNKGVCYLSGLSVTPDVRKRKRATFLMMCCERRCKDRGVFRIDLNSVLEKYVMDFYHSLGYIDVKENDGYMLMYKMLK